MFTYICFSTYAEQGHKSLNITNMAQAHYISQMENTDYVVTFSIPLPDFRISLMKGSKEYFAIAYSIISHFGNHMVANLPLCVHLVCFSDCLEEIKVSARQLNQRNQIYFLFILLHEGF